MKKSDHNGSSGFMKTANNIMNNTKELNKLYLYKVSPLSQEVDRQIKRWGDKIIRRKQIKAGLKLNDKEYRELRDNINLYSDIRKNTQHIDFDVDNNEKGVLSEIFGQAVHAVAMGKGFRGLLKCNIDLSKLAKSKDGLYRGFCFDENGKFCAQAKFMDVDKVAAATPMIAFQAASFITGQYYQHVITQQLNEIGSKISYIASYLEAEDKNQMLANYNQLKRLINLDSFTDEDFIMAVNALREMDKLRGKYYDLIESININVKRSLLKNENEINSWCNELNKSGFIDKMNCAYRAEMLYYFYNMILIQQYYKKYGKDNDHTKVYMELYNPCFFEKYSQKYHEIKYTVVQNIKMLSDDADINKENCLAKLKDIETKFAEIEHLYSNGQEMLQPTLIYKIEDGEIKDKYILKIDE